MEASGHYYTVYFVSLAVGFDDDVAREFAFYAQLPDQLDKLDAADLEKKYFTKVALESHNTRLDKGDRVTPEEIKYKKKKLEELNTENYWRVLIERTLHALTGKNAKVEQNKTVEVLRKTYSENFSYAKFGFLLHRLGDTFAHTRLNDKIDHYHFEPVDSEISKLLYKANFGTFSEHGHAHDGTHPDHPWQREKLFMNYLDTLYGILYELAAKEQRSPFPRTTCIRVYSLTDVKAVFKIAIREAAKAYIDAIHRTKKIHRDLYLASDVFAISDSGINIELQAQTAFITILFFEIRGNLRITSPSTYAPEKNELMTYTALKMKYPNIPSWEYIEKYAYEIKEETATSME